MVWAQALVGERNCHPDEMVPAASAHPDGSAPIVALDLLQANMDFGFQDGLPPMNIIINPYCLRAILCTYSPFQGLVTVKKSHLNRISTA